MFCFAILSIAKRTGVPRESFAKDFPLFKAEAAVGDARRAPRRMEIQAALDHRAGESGGAKRVAGRRPNVIACYRTGGRNTEVVV